MKKNNRLLVLMLITALLLSSAGCNKESDPAEGIDTRNSLSSYTEVETDAVVTDDETEELPMAEPAEKKELPVSESALFNYVALPEEAEPLYRNPLTGLGTAEDLSDHRPVAVMVGNIQGSMPQVGIGEADIIYEALAEGGITRLLVVVNDYEGLEKIGSVRSSRPYYIDFAANHDAVYVHAGGSDDAYSQLRSRGINNMDGVNGAYAGTIFYRDPERLATMASWHTMVTEGALISRGMELFGYRDTVDGDFVNPVKFPEWGVGVELVGDKTEYIKIPYNTSRSDTQIVEYEYDAETGKYMRFQFNHNEHIDGATGEQLAFDNIIVLNLKHYATGDSYGHRDITTTGSGSGYYITGGKRISIKWAKETKDGNITFTTDDNKPLVLNRGKTIINIVEDSAYSSLTLN